MTKHSPLAQSAFDIPHLDRIVQRGADDQGLLVAFERHGWEGGCFGDGGEGEGAERRNDVGSGCGGEGRWETGGNGGRIEERGIVVLFFGRFGSVPSGAAGNRSDGGRKRKGVVDGGGRNGKVILDDS